MKAIISFIVVILIFAVALAFGVRNEQIVQLNYLIAQDEYHLSALLGMVFGIGLVVGWLSLGVWLMRLKIANRRLNRQLKRQGKELEELRTMPVKD
ncbi:LapA family protein [Dongshaea marina]|uniref:LapA family protein n=1 Tax=Dongshaea marina TaxID=2047966 RepID=UPI000D3EA421|nr:lipopolysaccharide assembly protein LapA domain-containing protein [Dongshaea marina]